MISKYRATPTESSASTTMMRINTQLKPSILFAWWISTDVTLVTLLSATYWVCQCRYLLIVCINLLNNSLQCSSLCILRSTFKPNSLFCFIVHHWQPLIFKSETLGHLPQWKKHQKNSNQARNDEGKASFTFLYIVRYASALYVTRYQNWPSEENQLRQCSKFGSERSQRFVFVTIPITMSSFGTIYRRLEPIHRL